MVLLRYVDGLALCKSCPSSWFNKRAFYDLKPVLAVNEGPDYENKNYEGKYLFS